jgi:hypothetical protein
MDAALAVRVAALPGVAIAGHLYTANLGIELVTQPGQAGYLGAELVKPEAAMRLGLRYEQDKPLRACGSAGNEGSSSGGLA